MSFEDDIEGDDDAPMQVAAGGFPDRTPSEIEHQVCAVSRNSSLEDICAMLDLSDWLLARAKSINLIAKQRAIEWIDAHGPFDIGVVHYHVAPKYTTRCVNTKRCAHELLECVHGDFDRFLDVLIAQPYKPTAARAVLADPRYGNLFSRKCTSKLVAGVPERVLTRTDTRFQR